MSLPTQLLSFRPINRIHTTNGPSAFLDGTTTEDLPNHGSPAPARQCFRLHRLSLIHLGSPPRRSVPQWVFFFVAVHVFLVQLSTDYVFVASEHQTVPLQPSGRESPSVPEDTSTTTITPPPYCLNNPVGTPPELRQPLPVPEPVVLFFSGYDFSEPGIGLGGRVPPSLPTHHQIPPLPSSELELIFFRA